jgi:hypothetical protein
MRLILLISLLSGCGKSGGGVPMGGGGTGFEPNLDEPPDPPPDPDTADPGTGSDTGSSSSSDDTASSGTDADGGPPDDGGDGDDTAAVIEGTGYSRGDVAYNLSANDQNGLPFALHDRYGSKVALVVGNLDVGTTRDTLNNLADIASDHSDVSFVALIGRDELGIQCNQACAATVQSTYGFSPVLWEASAAMPQFNNWAQAQNTRTYLINTEMVIDWTKDGTANGSQVDGKLDDLE